MSITQQTPASAKAPPPLTPKAAVSKVKPGHAGGKVIVASKLPMALELQLEVKTTTMHRYKGEVWPEEVYAKQGDIFTIAGTAYPVGAPPEGVEWADRPKMIAGYALTYNVDAEFWEKWLEQKGDTPMVKNRLIFAFPDEASVRAECKNNREVDSFLGPIKHSRDKDGNPQIDDPRNPKKLRARDRKLAAGVMSADDDS